MKIGFIVNSKLHITFDYTKFLWNSFCFSCGYICLLCEYGICLDEHQTGRMACKIRISQSNYAFHVSFLRIFLHWVSSGSQIIMGWISDKLVCLFFFLILYIKNISNLLMGTPLYILIVRWAC